MKKTCCTLLCTATFVALPLGVLAADITVDSSTIVGLSQRDVTGASTETLAPATQFLGLSADKLADGNLSLHLSGWGRLDLADKSYNDCETAGSLTYGYLQYRFKQAGATIRAGRLFVHEGIANEHVDGISARTDLPFGFGLSAFGGATVHTAHLSGESSDGKGDTIYGGRLNYRYKGLLELGVTAVEESAAPTLASHTAIDYRRIGGDIWLAPTKTIDLMGHSSYNQETKEIADHSYLLSYKPTPKLLLSGEYNHYNDQSYLYSWTMFSKAALKPGDKTSVYGANGSYEINPTVTLIADYKHYDRDRGNADRFGGEVRGKFKDNTIRGGLGYHYLDAGQGFAITPYTAASYHEVRCYVMQDTKSYFAAVDLLGDFFTEKIYNESSAWEAIASLGYHFTPSLALSGDLSYGRNPQFTEEVKGLLRLTYNMTFTGTGGKK